MGLSHSNNHGNQQCNKQKDQDSTEASRKLSNVSNRNIQLLSIRQRSEKDNYADGLRQRRRSSLINLILGAATSGPRFCDDLCSLNSYLTDYNFGIEYFAPSLSALDNINSALGAHPYCSRTVSIASTIAHKTGLSSNSNLATEQRTISGTGENNYNHVNANPDPCADHHHQQQQQQQRRRRRSSLGSFVAHLSNDDDDNNPCRTGRRGFRGENAPRSIVRQSSVVSSGAGSCYGPNWPPNASADAQVQVDPATNNQRKAQLMHRASQFASIDLTSSFDKHCMDPSSGYHQQQHQSAAVKTCRSAPLRRCGSELSLYSSSGSLHNNNSGYNNYCSRTTPGSPANRLSSILCNKNRALHPNQLVSKKKTKPAEVAAATTGGGSGGDAAVVATTGKETRTIIMLQVCLPFIFAGFGNVAAGLVLNWIAHWNAFKNLPIFFVLLPPFVGLKGNIEMTFASRLSTLAHLNLLDTKLQWRRAYVSNLILMLSQAIGLSLFASMVSILCETLILRHTSAHSHHHVIILHSAMAASDDNFGKSVTTAAAAPDSIDHLVKSAFMVVLPSALCTSMILVVLSSFVVSFAICVAKYIRVNPDNLSTLVAALYGDASCVLTYGLVAEIMYRINQRNIIIWPLCIVFVSLLSWPLLWYIAFRFKETRAIALSSMPAIMGSISISIGSGAILSQVVEKFRLIALYQPVVNGFGANLIAVQASRVSTWLWCTELRKISLNQRQQIPGLDPIKDKELSNSLVSFFGDQQLRQQPQQQPPSSASDGSDSQQSRRTIMKRAMSKLKLLSKSIGTSTKSLIETIKSTVLWSFCNLSPNSIAARLLLIAIIPAHTIYFVVIWMLSARGYVIITWQFYFIYIALCLIQVFILLAICEPLMTLLMNNRWDPDTLGISLLMAMADLVGTLCLAGGFYMLATMGDINAMQRV